MKNIKMMKEELKALAVEIRQTKSEHKEAQRKSKYSYEDFFSLRKLKKLFRHKHIAYCILRGRTYDQIEQKCEEAPDFVLINDFMEEYKNEDVCLSS